MNRCRMVERGGSYQRNLRCKGELGKVWTFQSSRRRQDHLKWSVGVDLELEERKGHFEKNGWYVVHFSIFLHIISLTKGGVRYHGFLQ